AAVRRSGLGQRGDDVAGADLVEAGVAAAHAEVHLQPVAGAPGGADVDVEHAVVHVAVARAGGGETVVDEGAQAVALDRVVGRALLHVQHARGRRVAAEAAGVAVADGGVQGPVLGGLVAAAGEHRAV